MSAALVLAESPEVPPENVVRIDVMPRTAHSDVYLWEAIYSDGEVLPEVAGDGRLHHLADIDQERLIGFRLLPVRPGLPAFGVQFLLGDGRRLVFTRRRGKPLMVGADGSIRDVGLPPPPVWHLVGWQRTEGEGDEARTRMSILYISETGGAFLSEDFNVPLGQ